MSLWARELMKRVAEGILLRADVYMVELTVRLTKKMCTLMTPKVSRYRGCLAFLGLTSAESSRFERSTLSVH